MLSDTEEKKICLLAIFANLSFWMMFFWTCLSSHMLVSQDCIRNQ